MKIQDKGLQVSCTGEIETIKADEYLMMQILDNLISNAVEYTPEGNKIEIRGGQRAVSLENYGVTIPGIFCPMFLILSSAETMNGRLQAMDWAYI